MAQEQRSGDSRVDALTKAGIFNSYDRTCPAQHLRCSYTTRNKRCEHLCYICGCVLRGNIRPFNSYIPLPSSASHAQPQGYGWVESWRMCAWEYRGRVRRAGWQGGWEGKELRWQDNCRFHGSRAVELYVAVDEGICGLKGWWMDDGFELLGCS